MIQGYRRFTYASTLIIGGRTHRLRGRFGAFWETKELTAQCNKNVTAEDGYTRAQRHLANDEDCTCGIYISKTTEPHSSVQDEERYSVEALVTGWGAYVEYDAGWRVQHARIESIKVFSSYPEDEQLAPKIASYYKVPTIFVSSFVQCCGRQHTRKIYKTSNGWETTICKIPTEDLHVLIDKFIMMPANDFSIREVKEIQLELLARKAIA